MHGCVILGMIPFGVIFLLPVGPVNIKKLASLSATIHKKGCDF
jgi:hypothetical protein